ncbi:hypothetical protein R3P38DRAFT_3225568 [Favolaschia claudopus]|uniref:Uncharacterized protein n=1 Tax=Favolaschia claudopus TaxID=2862362 RepID=A0AAV9ZU44_9AGAR
MSSPDDFDIEKKATHSGEIVTEDVAPSHSEGAGHMHRIGTGFNDGPVGALLGYLLVGGIVGLMKADGIIVAPRTSG